MLLDLRRAARAKGDVLFKPLNARPTPGLGLSRLDLLAPNNFPEGLRTGADSVSYCGMKLLWLR